jgi:hypothetical protein
MLLRENAIRVESILKQGNSHGIKKLVKRLRYIFPCVLGCGKEISVYPQKLKTHTGRCRLCAGRNRKDRVFCHCGLRAVGRGLCQQHYYEKYKEELSAIGKKWLRSLKGRWSNLKRAIKCSGVPSDIDLPAYSNLIKNPCWYCGGLLNESGHGLDKKIPKSGYTLQNVVPCCVICNRIKNKYLTHEEMKVAMKAVIEYRSKMSVNNYSFQN